MFNNSYNEPLHSFTIPFEKGEKTINKDYKEAFSNFTKPNSSNKLALFFKEKLDEQFIEKANLNRIHSQLRISFELDKKHTPFNIKTNARSYDLEKQIIANFKEYPIEDLNFADKSDFNYYTIQILSFTDSKNIINTSSVVSYMRIPIFVGCEFSKDNQAALSCFSRNIQMHFSKKFDTNLPNRLGLPKGKLSIFISFKINKNGNITKIVTKLSEPSEALDIETRRIMSLIPKMKSAGEQNGKVVTVSHGFPFTIYVE